MHTAMPSMSCFVVGCVLLVLPAACTGGAAARTEAGAGGNTAGAGGSTASGGVDGGVGGDGGGGVAGAGSGGMSGANGGGSSGEGLRFVPEGLANTELDGEAEGLTLIAFTLVQGATGPELYAAIRNHGDTPACDAGMMVYFIDQAEQLVATWGDSLRGGRLYRLNDGSGVIIPCVAPGEIAMTGSTDLPDGIEIEALGSLQHAFPAFTVDVVPVAGSIGVSELQIVSRGAGSAYTGTLENGLDVTVSDVEVTVFPVNGVGRPLGVATSSSAAGIQAGGTWTFETTPVDDVGVGYVVYPTVAFAQ